MIRVLLADDHTLLRQGLRRLLAEDPRLRVVGEAASGTEAVAQSRALHPDILLMDLQMPGMTGIEATRQIRQTCPETRVIILTVSDKDADLIGALKAGARSYLLKNCEAKELLEAIRRVAQGGAVLAPDLTARVLDEFAASPRPAEPLSDREQDVLHLVAQGLSNKEIAARLSLTENTVKTHVQHILRKLHLRGRAEAAAYAVRTGLGGNDRAT
jgi:DNA-binding NarL/FixJ family response regulator